MELDTDFYLLGLQRAYGRFFTGGDRLGSVIDRALLHEEHPDVVPNPFEDVIPPSGRLIALFEALNWASALGDKLQQEWRVVHPDESWWWQDVPAGETARALRFARNSVHHDWAQAIVLPEVQPPTQTREGWHLWRWADALSSDRPDPEGEAAYQSRLAREVAGITLIHVTSVFVQGMLLVLQSQPQAAP